MASLILHIAPRSAAAEAHRQGYVPEDFARDGFVHCSTAEQVAGVADALFADVPDLVLLCINPGRLAAPVRWEPATNEGPRFPHIYGPVTPEAIVDIVAFERGEDGRFDLPWDAAVLARRPPHTLEELAARLTEALGTYTGRWWVAGGWALDLYLDRVSRPHEDLDITLPRSEVARFVEEMPDWELRIPTPARLVAWLPDDYPPEQHQIWARPRSDATPDTVFAFSAHPLALDVLIEDIDDSGWRFRHEPGVLADIERYGRVGRGGLPYVAPEVQLLYKAKPHPTGMEHNDADFAAVVPHLDIDARRWLRPALERSYPEHHWLRDARLH